MKNLFVTLAALAAVVAMNEQALACTYDPMILKNKNELGAVALTTLGQAIDEVNSVTVEFEFQETKPTPMCPDEIQYKGQYVVNWTAGRDLTFPKPCTGVVTVTKTVNYQRSRSKPKITVAQSAPSVVCAP